MAECVVCIEESRFDVVASAFAEQNSIKQPSNWRVFFRKPSNRCGKCPTVKGVDAFPKSMRVIELICRDDDICEICGHFKKAPNINEPLLSETIDVRRNRRTLLALVMLPQLLFLGLLLSDYLSSGFAETPHNYFGHLGQSFRQGRIDTPLLSGQLDVSTYNEKTYLYWGPAGGLMFAAGNLVYEPRISDRFVATILMSLNFYIWFLISCEMCSNQQVSIWELAVMLAFACFGGLFITMFKYPGVWQMGHIIAYTGMSLAVYGIISETIRLNVAVAGFCLAMSSRISLVILAPGLALLACYMLHKPHRNYKNTLLEMLCPTGFVVATLLLLAAYNYVRFDSILEFGEKHKSDIPYFRQLTLKYGTVSLHHVPRNAFIYFVDPIKLSRYHPYIVYSSRGNAIWSYHPAIYIIPLAWIIFDAFKNETSSGKKFAGRNVVVQSFVLLWCLYLFFLCCLVWTGENTFGGRYLCDVEPLLLAGTLYSYVKVRDSRVFRSMSVAAMAVSIAIKVLYLIHS